MTTNLRRFLLLAPLALTGACFNPSFKENIACGAGGECPPDLVCWPDLRCHSGARPGAPDASLPMVADAAADAHVFDAAPDARPPVDATPVGCQGNNDCATPPNACFQAGTCNTTTHMCSFPAVVCQADDCNSATCDTVRGCVKTPINENQSCGVGTSCGAFGACGGFPDACSRNGSRSRTCTNHTCHTGVCTAADTTDTENCLGPSTTGNTCGTPTETCGGCDYTTECSNHANESCTCTNFTCDSNQTCQSSSSSCDTTCNRNTDGDFCGGSTSTCCFSGVCTSSCSPP